MARGEVVLFDGAASTIALVPTPEAGDVMRWQAFLHEPALVDPDPVSLGAAEHALRDAVREAPSALLKRSDIEPSEAEHPAEPRPATAPARLIQLGAYASEAMAQAAWEQLSGRSELQGVQPVFEPVERGGSRLVRLKVGPLAPDVARGLCRKIVGADPWCARG